MHTLILILLAAASLLAISLERSYRQVPVPELKRRAREGDNIAELLHQAAAYGHSLRAVLWFLVGASNAAFFLLTALYTPVWFALAVSAALIWIGFFWLPARDVSRFIVWLAAKLAPVFAWFLNYLHPILDRIIVFIKHLRPIHIHTGLYSRDDLLDLLERQQVQAGNRIEKVELDIAAHALTFGNKLVREVMTPRRTVKSVAANETIGPVLMSELHDSGHSRFPVYKENKDKAESFVGVLFLRDLLKAQSGGHVDHLMHPGVFYLHEEQTLYEALKAILKTRHHLFIVVDSFEEYVGIITMEDVFEQIIGEPIVDEFDEYEDLRAVAAREAKAEHKDHEKDKEEVVESEPAAEEPQKIVHKEEDIDDTITI